MPLYASFLTQAGCELIEGRNLLSLSLLAVTSSCSHLETKHLEAAVTNVFNKVKNIKQAKYGTTLQ